MVVRRQVRARAASHSGAYHRSGLIFCDNGLLYMYAGPDMRSQSPAFVQGVAFRIVLFRWDGSKWAYNNEYPAYWWTTADYHSAPFAYYDENDEQTFRDQGFYINVPGYYRLAVRYHWWPNTSGGVAGSAWHWGGAHRYPSSGVANDYCQYA